MSSKTTTIISSGALLLAVSVSGQATEICHVANAGFLVKGEKSSVLIDGLMIEDQYDGRFALPSETTQQQMMERTELYDNLSIVVATHRHGDHFDPKATVAHIRANPSVSYVLPADTLPSLEANGLGQTERTRITFAPDNTQSNYSFDDVRIEVYDVDHGPNMPQNNGYRITVDGKAVFHTGDINATRAHLSASGINALPVDALLIPFWFGMGDEAQRATIAESWTYQHIVPTHFSAKPAAWMEQYGGFGKLKEAAAAAFDNVIIIATEGECTELQ